MKALGLALAVASTLPMWGGNELGGMGVHSAWARSPSPCPSEMSHIGSYCIDRWEVHTVESTSGRRLSPFYPPEVKLLRRVFDFWSTEAARTGQGRARKLSLPPLPAHQRAKFLARAVSAPGVLPQAYMTYYSARDSCARAGKRLCSEREWTRACRGAARTKHPYGSNFRTNRCNVFRAIHPAYELHGNSSLGHLDPRLHLVVEDGDKPLLLLTGEEKACVSQGADGEIFDMVGNLDEWIDDPSGTFVGGFFSRQTREGCEAKIENHAPAYTDYSLGTRCCRDAR